MLSPKALHWRTASGQSRRTRNQPGSWTAAKIKYLNTHNSSSLFYQQLIPQFPLSLSLAPNRLPKHKPYHTQLYLITAATMNDRARAFEQRFNLRFNNITLLTEALTAPGVHSPEGNKGHGLFGDTALQLALQREGREREQRVGMSQSINLIIPFLYNPKC